MICILEEADDDKTAEEVTMAALCSFPALTTYFQF